MTDATAAIQAPHPTRTLIAMTGSLSMIFLDATVVGVALPTIQADLGLTMTSSAWVINGFLIALASSLAIGGRVADRFGRLRVFRIAIVLFAAASVMCGLANSTLWIIAARVIQGIGAGLMQPASTAIVIASSPPDRRGVSMAMYFGIAVLFLMAGPIIGGVIISMADWPWIFLLNLPVAIIAFLLTISLELPNHKSLGRGVDVLGIVLLLLGLPLLILGLEWIAHPPGGLDGLPLVTSLVGLCSTVLCIVHCTRSANPILNVALLAPRPMLGQALVLSIGSLIMAAQAVYGAIFLQEVLGFTPLQAGVGALPLLLPVLLVIRFAGKWYDTHGATLPMTLGMATTALGLAVETTGIMLHSYVVLAVGMVLVGAGSTVATTPANTDVLARAPQDQRGETSGMVQTMRQFGASLGIVACVLSISLVLQTTVIKLRSDHKSNSTAMLAIEGNIEAIVDLDASDPQLAKQIRQARSDGLAMAFVLQGCFALAGVVLSLTLARPDPDDQ